MDVFKRLRHALLRAFVVGMCVAVLTGGPGGSAWSPWCWRGCCACGSAISVSLKAFEEEGIPVDILVGTSMGWTGDP